MNAVLSRHIPIAKLIADTFGPCCEVVLHDLTTPQHSVVYTAGGNVTGRAVGQSFDHLIPNVLLSRELQEDCVSNYPIAGERGRRVKSSTALIRDEAGAVVGALCVNVDLTGSEALLQQLSAFCSTVSEAEEPKPRREPVEVLENVRQVVDSIVERTIGSQDTSVMSREERVELVRFLQEKGVFLIRGSVEQVAGRLNVSPVTVYSYLDSVSRAGE